MQDNPSGRDVLEQTLRDTARRRFSSTTSTEQMRAALALFVLLDIEAADSTKAATIAGIINSQ